MKHRDYKLIACDLDGTLLGTDLGLSDDNKAAISYLAQKGVYIVPSTGRTLSEMQEVYSLPEVRYIIYSNGAAILDKKTGKCTFFGLNKENANYALNTLFSYDMYAIIHKNGETYADFAKTERMDDYNVCLNVKELVRKYCNLDKFFEKSAYEADGVESIVAFFRNNKDKEECRKKLLINSDLRVADAWDFNIEIFSNTAGKGTALEYLADKLQIEMGDVISIGDSDNDAQMTKMSGLGLVADNGSDSLKKIADDIICSNDDGVIKYVKDHYFR